MHPAFCPHMGAISPAQMMVYYGLWHGVYRIHVHLPDRYGTCTMNTDHVLTKPWLFSDVFRSVLLIYSSLYICLLGMAF